MISPLDDEYRVRLPAALIAAVNSRSDKPLSYWTDMLKPAGASSQPGDSGGSFDGLSADDVALLRLLGVGR